MSSGDWIVRDSLPDDEPCLAHLWLSGMKRTSSMRQRFGLERDQCTVEAVSRYWSVAQPVVTAVLRSPHVTKRVVCPEGREHYRDGATAIIAAFIVYDGNHIHWVTIKASMLQLEGVGRELLDAMLPVSVDNTRTSAMCMFPDVGRAGASPKWTVDDRVMHHLLDVSYRRLNPDAFVDDATKFILDPNRDVWHPRPEAA